MFQKQIDKKKFTAALASVSEGLAQKDLVPILSSYCFEGGFVTTFDDIITIQAPCPELEGFEGALRGSVMTGWLAKQKAESVKLTVDGSAARFNHGSARISLPVLPKSDFQFKLPDLGTGTEVKGPGLAAGIVDASRSLGLDPAHQWRLGITLAFDSDGIDVYASDNGTCTLSEVQLGVPASLVGRTVVVPPRLVELVRDDKSAPISWIFLDNVLAVEYPDDRTIYCRTLGHGKIEGHRGPFAQFNWEKGFAKIPERLPGALEECLLFFSDKADATACIKLDGDLTLSAKSGLGEFSESMSFGEAWESDFVISPTMLRRMLVNMDAIKFTNAAVQLQSESADVLCSVLREG